MQFTKIRNTVTTFLHQYKQQNPATHAAAQQAIGGILILDGIVGIDNPISDNKRPGIAGAVMLIIFGCVSIVLFPMFINHFFDINKMTGTTTATVISVDRTTSRDACSAVLTYTVNGRVFENQPSSYNSSNLCGITPNSTIDINYNPANPAKWSYDLQTFSFIFVVFYAIGGLLIITGLFTFIVRLLCIVYGWKLLQSGRKAAKNLPQGTNIDTLIAELKRQFSALLFNNTSVIIPQQYSTMPIQGMPTSYQQPTQPYQTQVTPLYQPQAPPQQTNQNQPASPVPTPSYQPSSSPTQSVQASQSSTPNTQSTPVPIKPID